MGTILANDDFIVKIHLLDQDALDRLPWLYDFEELDRRLREAGFSTIENVAWGESKYAELRERETRQETVLICEATK